jgi:hypothetical protein
MQACRLTSATSDWFGVTRDRGVEACAGAAADDEIDGAQDQPDQEDRRQDGPPEVHQHVEREERVHECAGGRQEPEDGDDQQQKDQCNAVGPDHAITPGGETKRVSCRFGIFVCRL